MPTTTDLGALANCVDTDVDAENEELISLYNLERSIKQRGVLEPSGLRASVLGPDDVLRESFPDWCQPFTAGRLLTSPHIWTQVFAEFGEIVPSWLHRWLSEGYSVRLDKDNFGNQPGINKLVPEETEFVSKAITEWLVMGCCEEVARDKVHHKAVQCNLLVAYRNGCMERVCWSGKSVNLGVDDKSFKMETLEDIMGMSRPGDKAFSLDFEKGFYQFRLASGLSQLLYFRHAGKTYRWLVLPMGLKSAPRDFSKLIKRVLLLFRKMGIRCSFFIDDLIFLGSSEEELLHIRFLVLTTLYRLGLRVSLKKSLLNGGDIIKHLGMDLDFVSCAVWIPECKVAAMKKMCVDMLTHHTQGVSARKIASLVGKLISVKLASPLALILSKGLSRSIAHLTMPGVGHNATYDDGYESLIRLSK